MSKRPGVRCGSRCDRHRQGRTTIAAPNATIRPITHFFLPYSPPWQIAPLEDTINAYLQQVLPCLTAEQAEATKAKAALFLETDGPR